MVSPQSNRQYDEETEELSDDLKNITGVIANLTKTASNSNQGISLFTDESKKTYKSTYQIMKDISAIWDELSDKDQAELLEALAGKRNSQVVAAAIQNFASAERAMIEMADSQGNAMTEMEIAYDSIEYKINEFKQTIVGLGQKALTQDFTKGFISFGTKIIEVLDSVIEKAGVILTILGGVVVHSGLKSIGLFSKTIRAEYIQYGQTLTALSTMSRTLATDTTALAFAVSNLTPRQQALTLASRGLNQAQIEEVLILNEVDKVKARQIALDVTATQTKKQLTMANMEQILVAQGLNKATAVSIMRSAGIIASDEAEVISKNQVKVATLQAKLAQEGLSAAQIQGVLAQVGLASSTSALSLYFKGLAASIASSLKSLVAFIAAHPAMAIAAGIGVATGFIVKYFKKQKEANKEAKEAALESIDAFEAQEKSVKSLVEQYTKYISSTSDLTTVKDELSDIQSQLVDIYGDEANQLDLLNKSYAENIALITKKNKADAEQRLRDNRQAYDDARKVLEYDSKVKKSPAYGDNTLYADENVITLEAIGIGGWSEKTQKAWSELADNIQFDPNNSNLAYITGSIEEQIKTLDAIYEDYNEQIKGTDKKKYFDRLDDIAAKAKTAKQKKSDAEVQLEQEQTDFKIISDGEFFEDLQKNKEFEELTNNLIEFNHQFNETASTAEKIELGSAFLTDANALKVLIEGNSEAESSVQSLFNTMNSSLTQFKNGITSSASLYKENLETYLSDDGTFNDTNDNIAKYTGALDDLSEKGIVTASVMNDLIALDSDLINSFTKVGDGFHVSTDALIASKDKLINKELEYVETEKKSSKKVLTDLKLQLREVKKQRSKLENSTQPFGSAEAFKQQQQQLEEYDTQIENITQEIAEVENATDHWNNIQSQLNSSLGDTTSHLKELENQADALEDTIDKLEESIDKIESEISDLEDKQSELLEYQEYQIDNIINKIESEKEVLEKEKEILEEQVTALEEQQEQLEELISNYEKVVDVISDVVDKQIEAIETERDAVEKHYDDIIEKLQEQNEEREKAITLAEKQANLENAQRNKIRQYNEQTGWTYVQDQEAIYNAQKELDDFKAQNEIDTLEKEKENALKGYDEQIEAWEEYVKLWEEAVDSYSEIEDNLIAEQILGSDWLEKIKNKDTTTLNTFKNNYNTYQNTLNTVIQREIDSLNQSIKAKEKDIEAKEKQIDSWNDYKNELSNYVDSVSKKWSDYVSMVGQVTLDENSSLEERASNLETFKNNYNAITDQILAKQGELAGMTAELESAQGTLEALQERIDNYNAEQQAQTLNTIAGKDIEVKNKFAELEYQQSIFTGNAVDAENMNKLAEEIRTLISEIAELYALIGMDYKPDYNTSLIGGIPHYSTGGVNTTTGVSWLDGTPSKPELVLNNSQATKLWNLLNTMSSSQLAKIFRLDSLGQPPESLRQLANNSSMVTNNQNSQSINLIFNGNIIANNPVDFMQQMNSYVQHNKLNGRIKY